MLESVKTLIVIPTFNEAKNMELLLPAIRSSVPEIEVLVVDDNSPDGTANVVKELQLNWPALHLLNREKKEGLAKAYLAGFEWALNNHFTWIGEMDADFSHRIVDLQTMLSARDRADFIVGSRWVPGGGTKNWGLGRKCISLGGSFYSRTLLGFPLRDWTGGFNLWNASVLRAIGLKGIESQGYSFQIELKYKAFKNGFKVAEVPILFEDRRYGQSKMSPRIFFEALWRVWKIRAR